MMGEARSTPYSIVELSLGDVPRCFGASASADLGETHLRVASIASSALTSDCERLTAALFFFLILSIELQHARSRTIFRRMILQLMLLILLASGGIQEAGPFTIIDA